MDVILATVAEKLLLVKLDYLVVFSETLGENTHHNWKVPTHSNNAGVTLKLKNCHFFTETIDYLGHVIHSRRPKIASHSTDTIRGLQELTDITTLRSFLGPSCAFRQFILIFERLAAPLNKKLRKISWQDWTTQWKSVLRNECVKKHWYHHPHNLYLNLLNIWRQT